MSTIGSSLASSWASSIFSKLDTSNQGYIDKAGLQSAFDSISSSSGSSSSVDDLFSSMDSDSDGKVTKSELTSSLEQLATQLNNAFDQMRMGGSPGSPGGGHGGPPPGPPPSDGQSGNSMDAGFTKDELTQQLSDMGSSDSKRSNLISSIVNNFDKADTDGDGKVNREEAMAYGKSQQNASSSADATASNSSSSSKSSEAAYMMQMMMLTQAYGANSTTGLLNSSLSVAA